jgi:yeast amino acid transporter
MSAAEYGKEPKGEQFVSSSSDQDLQQGQISDNADNLHRRLSNRQIQLLAIGGSIGTALFVSIGNGLAAGGPGALFVAYIVYSLVVACVNNCISEMIILQPVSGGFIRLAGKWYDDALGFMVGWNFFIYEALLIPFEITAISLVLEFWRDDIPPAAICVACIVLYAYVFLLQPHPLRLLPVAIRVNPSGVWALCR